MILTGLFALSIAGFSMSELSFAESVSREDAYLLRYQWLTAVLLLVTGIAIDLSKFVFWASERGIFYSVISLLLMAFSLSASTSFFITSELDAIRVLEKESPRYQTVELQLHTITNEINANNQLVEKRLSSAYHKQWELAEQTVEKNKQLSALLGELNLKQKELGESYAREANEVTRFFISIARLIDVEENHVRLIFYGVLAFLLEICALASLRITGVNSTKTNSSHSRIGRELRMKQLKCDIREGKTIPKVRQIKELDYSLGSVAIKEVLDQLFTEGVLENDVRGSYRLKS